MKTRNDIYVAAKKAWRSRLLRRGGGYYNVPTVLQIHMLNGWTREEVQELNKCLKAFRSGRRWPEHWGQ